MMITPRELPASLYLVVVVTVISASVTSATDQPSMTTGTSNEAQPCFHSVNNIQILTPNDSAKQDHSLNLSTIERQLSLSNEQLSLNNEELNDIQEQLSEIIQLLNQSKTTPVNENRPQDCLDLQRAGFTQSGQYKVYPDDGGDPFFVFCDMETDGGGWTVFQRWQGDTLDFYQDWQAYKNGFGPVYAEHWLGNEHIHRLTFQKRYALRVDLWDWEDLTAYAKYNMFYLAGEDLDYMLVLGGYSGTAGDSLDYHNGRRFSTKDAVNDDSGDCAQTRHGAWWYGNCEMSNLNGRYYPSSSSTTNHRDGLTWYHWKNNYIPLNKSEMKIRPN